MRTENYDRKNDDTHFWVNYLFKSSSSRVKHTEQRKPCSLFLLLSSLAPLPTLRSRNQWLSTSSCGLRGSRHVCFIKERILASAPNLQQWEDGIAYINSFLHRSWSAVRSTCTTKGTEDKVIRWNLSACVPRSDVDSIMQVIKLICISDQSCVGQTQQATESIKSPVILAIIASHHKWKDQSSLLNPHVFVLHI